MKIGRFNSEAEYLEWFHNMEVQMARYEVARDSALRWLSASAILSGVAVILAGILIFL